MLICVIHERIERVHLDEIIRRLRRWCSLSISCKYFHVGKLFVCPWHVLKIDRPQTDSFCQREESFEGQARLISSIIPRESYFLSINNATVWKTQTLRPINNSTLSRAVAARLWHRIETWLSREAIRKAWDGYRMCTTTLSWRLKSFHYLILLFKRNESCTIVNTNLTNSNQSNKTKGNSRRENFEQKTNNDESRTREREGEVKRGQIDEPYVHMLLSSAEWKLWFCTELERIRDEAKQK